MFGKEQLGYFLPLALFANMSSLNICGGDFYSDKLIDLLEQIGQGKSKPISFAFLGERLDELDIYAVGELDMKGVAMMTIFCRLIFLLFPSSTLYFVAGLKALTCDEAESIEAVGEYEAALNLNEEQDLKSLAHDTILSRQVPPPREQPRLQPAELVALTAAPCEIAQQSLVLTPSGQE